MIHLPEENKMAGKCAGRPVQNYFNKIILRVCRKLLDSN